MSDYRGIWVMAQLVDEKEKSSGLESQLANMLAERPR
jgi:hypothetical protein